MFNIDTGDTGGSLGPWISWTPNGSAMKGLKPESWVFRGKDDAGNKVEKEIEAFKTGCVIDLDTLQLGWEKDGGQGVAPERRWNPSLDAYAPRPSDDKKPGGGFIWSKALTMRCAIGNGEAATWEQSGYAAFDAFDKLSKQIMAEWEAKSQNGKLLPFVVQTGAVRQDLPKGSTSIPTLEIKEWMERPACLQADAPSIATDPATQQAAAATTSEANAGASAGGF